MATVVDAHDRRIAVLVRQQGSDDPDAGTHGSHEDEGIDLAPPLLHRCGEVAVHPFVGEEPGERPAPFGQRHDENPAHDGPQQTKTGSRAESRRVESGSRVPRLTESCTRLPRRSAPARARSSAA